MSSERMKDATAKAELPGAWKPRSVVEPKPISDVPDDIAESESWEVLCALHSGFAWSEQWRKIVLASAREIVRAKATLAGEKVSEARIDDVARTSSQYLGFCERHLRSRLRYEQQFRAEGGLHT